MPHYTITAKVYVDVEMTVEAASEDEARKMFDDNIAMTASLVGVPADKFDVNEDSISQIGSVRVRQEAA